MQMEIPENKATKNKNFDFFHHQLSRSPFTQNLHNQNSIVTSTKYSQSMISNENRNSSTINATFTSCSPNSSYSLASTTSKLKNNESYAEEIKFGSPHSSGIFLDTDLEFNEIKKHLKSPSFELMENGSWICYVCNEVQSQLTSFSSHFKFCMISKLKNFSPQSINHGEGFKRAPNSYHHDATTNPLSFQKKTHTDDEGEKTVVLDDEVISTDLPLELLSPPILRNENEKTLPIPPTQVKIPRKNVVQKKVTENRCTECSQVFLTKAWLKLHGCSKVNKKGM